MPDRTTPRDALLDALDAYVATIVPAPTPSVAEAEFISSAEAARLLGVRRNTVEIWRTKGTGPPYLKVTRNRVRYRRTDVIAFLERNERASTSAPVRKRRSK